MSMQAKFREMRQLRDTPEGQRLREQGAALLATPPPSTPPEPLSQGESSYRLSRIGLPALTMRAALEATDTPAVIAAKAWWGQRAEKPTLVLVGNPGIGKSTAAAWCVVEWGRFYGWNAQPTASNPEPAMWVDGPVMRTLGEWGPKAQGVLDAAAKARITVIDDAGWDGDQRARDAVAAVILERLERQRLLILTSNLRGEAFRARYGEALCSRLRKHAMVPALSGPDLRATP